MSGAEIEGIRVPEGAVDVIQTALDLVDGTHQETITREEMIHQLAGSLSAMESAKLIPVTNEYSGSIFADSPNLSHRLVENYETLHTIVDGLKALGTKIVLTSGSFDILHIGHTAYLEAARKCGDLLIVGVDSDEKIKQRKGPSRPVVSEAERVGMLSHIRGVGLITIKRPEDEKWELIKTVRPDTLIATEGTYTQEQVHELESKYVGKVTVLPPQATTSTSARIRNLQIEFGEELGGKIIEGISEIVEDYVKGRQ